MAPFTMRALHSGEIALAQDIYGEEIDWASVRIAQGPPLGFAAMVPIGSTILFANFAARLDFSAAPLGVQGLLVHELAHVWQARRGVVLAIAKLSAIGRGAYRYAVREGARFAEYNIESQAEIARHLFLARRGVTTLAPRQWLEAVWAGR
jgi:hypothetical protein